jgi:hypothetical protein
VRGNTPLTKALSKSNADIVIMMLQERMKETIIALFQNKADNWDIVYDLIPLTSVADEMAQVSERFRQDGQVYTGGVGLVAFKYRATFHNVPTTQRPAGHTVLDSLKNPSDFKEGNGQFNSHASGPPANIIVRRIDLFTHIRQTFTRTVRWDYLIDFLMKMHDMDSAPVMHPMAWTQWLTQWLDKSLREEQVRESKKGARSVRRTFGPELICHFLLISQLGGPRKVAQGSRRRARQPGLFSPMSFFA